MSFPKLTSTDVTQWLDCEKFINGFGRLRPNNPHAAFTQFPKEYQPSAESFFMPCYLIDAMRCLVFRSYFPNPLLVKRYLETDEGKLLFPVHPVNLGNHSLLHIDEIVRNIFLNVKVSPHFFDTYGLCIGRGAASTLCKASYFAAYY